MCASQQSQDSQPPKRERPSTYAVQDRQNQQELKRLTVQDQLVTASMGGVLPEQSDAKHIHRVLDVGCATGSWAIEAAKTYPDKLIIGIDISSAMIEYARSQASEQQVAERVEFRVMDALQMLEFPKDSFDLVNMRFSLSWLRTWDWPKLLTDMQRVIRPDGIIRLTESDIFKPNSPMFSQWCDLLLRSLYQAGNLFEQEVNSVSSHLAPLLTQYGFQNVRTKRYSTEYRGGTPQGEAFYEDWSRGMKTLRPFLQKWGGIPEDYDTLREQAELEMQQSDFRVNWNTLTAWGTKPE